MRAIQVMVGILVAVTSGCGFLDSDRGEHRLGVRFVERSGQAQTAGRLTQALSSGVEGLYFGELEMVAYDYRPGAAVQAGQGFGFDQHPDWSYWVALQSGHDAGRDNVLEPGEQLDFATMNGDFARSLEQEFVDDVGEFEIDFFEVYMYRTGVIHDGAYYGMNAENNGHDQHPLHKYPQWSTIDDTYCMPQFPGIPEHSQDVSVLFARSDWFPQAVVVNFHGNTGGADAYTVAASSIPLTQDQENLLTSLVGQGTRRRFYDNLVVIPFAGPKVVDLTAGTTGPTALTVDVNFDLSDILDPATDLDIPQVVFKGDASHVPFGLTVSFDD